MTKARAVVVGAGSISDSWFPPLIAEQVDIPGVVDLNIDAARKQVAKYDLDAQIGVDLQAMLKKTQPDFVVDLTTPQAHSKVTCTALKMDCHVIGEKPMAADMVEARRMVRTARQRRKLYMVSQSRRWDPLHQTVCDTIAKGKIGTATTVNCDFYIGAHFGGFRDQMPSPLILDMAIHHFDLARFFTGADPIAVYAHEFNPAGSWYQGNAAASCIFELSNGAVFTYRGSWCAEGCGTSWNGNWRIVGDKGTLLYANDKPPVGQIAAGKKGFHRPVKEVKMTVSTPKFSGMHAALREMLEFLRTGKIPQTECRDNIKSLAMVFAAVDSSSKKRRVLIKI